MERREKKSPYVRQQLQEACGGACGGTLPVIASNFEWVQSEKFLPNVSRGVEGRVDWRVAAAAREGGFLFRTSVRYHLDASLLDASPLESADTSTLCDPGEQCAVCSVQYAVSAVCSVQCAACSMQYAVSSIQ